ncbi:MAG: polysaccharide-degrading enzyme [Deltaproteobacteria bacterium]|nr:MAG: polysaccharide-degrading enzyme [Deltaproteobacteria bacterium]
MLPLLVVLLLPGVAARAAVYEVGPGQALAELDEVPWESLAPGDQVLVHWRSEPYRSKIILAVTASEQQPLLLRGVVGPDGQLPIIDGRDATTRAGINFWNEDRGVIKIGGSNNPDCDPPACVPSWIVVENLDVRSGRAPYRFSGRNGDSGYTENAAAIYVEVGRHITIRNCSLHDSGNGLFIGVFGGETRDILVEGNHLWDNGIEDSIYEHNSYTSARGIVFQFNHYGPLRAGCLGNNLKDRSAGLVVRYNWIENGNRQLDLVDGEDSQAVPDDPAYRSTFVYGNVLVEAEGEGNSQIVHYGGDSGDTSIYRKGTLYFYNNTVISTRSGNTTLLRLSTNDEHCDCRNNIVYATAGGSRLALLASNGVLDLSHNWLNEGWRDSHDGLDGVINDDGTNVTGSTPGFVDGNGQDFRPAAGSPAIDGGTDLAAAAVAFPVLFEYLRHQHGQPRPLQGNIDLGAFEYCPPGGCDADDGGGDVDGGDDADGGGGGDDGGNGDAAVDAGPPDAGRDAGGDDGGDGGVVTGDDGTGTDSVADRGGEAADDTGTADAPEDGADAGSSLQGACSCSPGSRSSSLPWLLVLLLVSWRRRKGAGST